MNLLTDIRLRRFSLPILAIALACAGFRGASTSNSNDSSHGTLVIIGGGMTKAMAPEVYGVLADHMPEHGVLGYLPTAGEKASANGDTRLASNLKGRTVKVIDLPPDAVAKANDPEMARQIAACDAIFFGGGAQSRVVKVFHPDGKSSLISQAVDEVLARGGVVAGTSAGAEIMTDPMMDMGDSEKALADPASLPIGPGMGYFPYGMVDQHFLQRGRFGRLIVALERTKRHFGFGVSEARAIVVDRASGQIKTVGKDAVVFIDNSAAEGRSNLRINLLGSGDQIDGPSGKITISDSKTSHDLGQRSGDEPAITDPWTRPMAIGLLIHGLMNGSHQSAVANDGHTVLTFTVDEKTILAVSKSDPENISVVGLRLDVRAKAATEPAGR